MLVPPKGLRRRTSSTSPAKKAMGKIQVFFVTTATIKKNKITKGRVVIEAWRSVDIKIKITKSHILITNYKYGWETREV